MPPAPDSSLAALTDEELVDIVKRDPARADAAFTELVERYGQQVLSVANRYSTDPENIAQDVWCIVWAKLGLQFDGRNFRAWLLSIVHNRGIDHIRDKREQSLTPGLEPSNCHSSLEKLILRERGQALEECIGELPERQQCIVRATLEQMKTADAASRCGVTPAQASLAKYYAIQALRDCTKRKGV